MSKIKLNINLSDNVLEYIESYSEISSVKPEKLVARFLTLGLNQGAETIEDAVLKGITINLHNLEVAHKMNKLPKPKVVPYQTIYAKLKEKMDKDLIKNFIDEEEQRVREEYGKSK